MDNEQ
jgi:hypothetical protein